MVDDNIEENFSAQAMRGVSQLAKLIDAGCALGEFDERRINRGEILAGVRTAETAEARESGGCRVDREEVKNFTSQRVENVRQFALQIAEFSGRRNHSVTAFIERL